MLNPELLHTNVREIVCETKFQKGNAFTNYSNAFSLSADEEKHKPALFQLETLFLDKKITLPLKNVVEMSISSPIEIFPETNRRVNFGQDYEGTFAIPIYVRANVVNDEVLLYYYVRLTRPDGSLTYIVSHTKKPEYSHPLYYGHTAQKLRTRVDGLPIHLSIDGRDNGDNPHSFHLKTSGERAVHFRRIEGTSVALRTTRNFQGVWHERMSFDDYDGAMKLTQVGVQLKGEWVK